jgi:hypothetical protein
MKKVYTSIILFAFALTLPLVQAHPVTLNAPSDSIGINSYIDLKKDYRKGLTVPTENSFNDIASTISGVPCSPASPLIKIQNSDAWKKYSDYMNKKWSDFDSKRLRLVRDWTNTELAEANKKTGLVFYPFGGPDCLTAFQFFPHAKEYILFGLEPVGNLPEVEKWKPLYMKSYLDEMKLSFLDFFTRGYFISKDMNQTLYGKKVNGVLPIICFFLTRSGYSINDMKRITFDDKGNILDAPYGTLEKWPKRPYGIRITFSPESMPGDMKTIYYLSCDVSDAGFIKNSQSYIYFDKLETMTVLIKSASYLLHYNSFSKMRNLLLRKSLFILQDDTGIPYRFFRGNNWEVMLYGRYSNPIKEFHGVKQPDLMAVYKANNAIGNLPFDLGYHWREKTDILMLIQRKEAFSN